MVQEVGREWLDLTVPLLWPSSLAGLAPQTATCSSTPTSISSRSALSFLFCSYILMILPNLLDGNLVIYVSFHTHNIVTYQHQPIWTASDKIVNTNKHDKRIIQNDAYQPKRSFLWKKMLNINHQGCTTAQMTLPTSHIFRVTEEVSGGRQSSFSMKILRYESSTPTSQELSSPFFQSLFVCLSGIKNTWPNLHFLHYIMA